MISEQWPPEYPSSRWLTNHALMHATKKYFIEHQLDRLGGVGKTSDCHLVFQTSPSMSRTQPIDLRHGLLVAYDGQKNYRMISRAQSIEVLRSMHPANRIGALQTLAWDHVLSVFTERFSTNECDCNDPRLQELFDDERRRLQPLMMRIEHSMTDEAMSQFASAHYTDRND